MTYQNKLLASDKATVAHNLATELHKEQFRKYSGLPYVTHLQRVARQTALLPGATEDMVAAAYLHDTLEDQAPTQEAREDVAMRILTLTGPLTLTFVNGLTNPSKQRKDLSRADRKKMDREWLAGQPLPIRSIKLVDRIDNLAETLFDSMNGYAMDYDFQLLYIQESISLLEALQGTNSDLENKLRVVAEQLGEWVNLVKLGSVS